MDWGCIFFAAGGGLLVQCANVMEIKELPKERRPDLDFWFWFPFVLSPIMGSFMAYAYLCQKIQLPPLLAVNVGVSAPVVLRGMLKILPKSPTGPID